MCSHTSPVTFDKTLNFYIPGKNDFGSTCYYQMNIPAQDTGRGEGPIDGEDPRSFRSLDVEWLVYYTHFEPHYLAFFEEI